MSKADVVHPTEVELFVKSLRKNEIRAIGSPEWYVMHEILFKISQQAAIETTEYREEVIREQLVLENKVSNYMYYDL